MADVKLQPGYDRTSYRRALGGFGTGVALVAAHDDAGRAHGLVINSLTSVSLDPPVILWCLSAASGAFDVFARAREFSVNILRSSDEELARQFSRRGDRLLPPEQLLALETGAPALAAAVATLDCRLRSHQTVGDHEVIFGDVVAYRTASDLDALGFFQGKYLKLSHGE